MLLLIKFFKTKLHYCDRIADAQAHLEPAAVEFPDWVVAFDETKAGRASPSSMRASSN